MILLTPGPTPVPESVLSAMARPPIPHRSAEFEGILAGCQPGLGRLFRTRGSVLTLAGSGTLAMESMIWSLTLRERTVAVCASGKFGERWGESATRAAGALGASMRALPAPWGDPIGADALASALDGARDVALVVIVHCETSTATISDARALAAVVRDRAPDALLAMDGITTVGAVPVEMDEWGIDAIACASQKALGLPPGLGLVALSDRAVERLGKVGVCPVEPRPLSLDLRTALDALRAGRTAFTPAINLVFGLAESLRLIEEEGLAARWRRAAWLARVTRDAACAMGLTLPSRAPSDSVTSIDIPDGLADQVRTFCAALRGVALAGGQGEWAGRVIRVSHMGYVGAEETRAGIDALAAALDEIAPGGFDTRAGRAIASDALAEERAP